MSNPVPQESRPAKAARILRWILVAIWLVFVWPHVHWSVSLTLVMVTIGQELSDWLNHDRFRLVQGIVYTMKAMVEKK